MWSMVILLEFEFEWDDDLDSGIRGRQCCHCCAALQVIVVGVISPPPMTNSGRD